MTLKEKQNQYVRFQSKLESAIYKIVSDVSNDTNTLVTDDFIAQKVAPDVWEYINNKLPALVKEHSAK